MTKKLSGKKKPIGGIGEMSTGKVAMLFSLLLCCGSAQAAEYYVSVDGSDTNPGTLVEPFSTIQKAADMMKAGDTCCVRGGRYHETVTIKNLQGTVEKPVIFKAYPGEEVVLDGTEPISSEWDKYRDGIYRTRLDKDVWQLFVGDRMMMAARWPNANLYEGSIWDQDKTWAHGSTESEFGKMVTRTEGGRPDLAATGKDFTGAMAVLNIGKWQTHSRRVNSHKAGSNAFTYDANNPDIDNEKFWDNGYWEETQRYYLECHLNCLDSEEEWYYNQETKELYLWTSGGGKPENVRGKTMTYAFEIDGASYLILSGFHFFGCTFSLRNATHSIVEDCDLEYYEYTERMLGVEDPGLWYDFTCSTEMRGPRSGSYNTIRNCKFAYCDGGALVIEGKYDLVENVLAHDLDFSGVGYHTFHLQWSDYSRIQHLTAYNTGASECISAGLGNVIELCDMGENLGSLQQDGAAIQFRPHVQFGSMVRYNWVHDNAKFGIRADILGIGPEIPQKNGSHITIHHNVVWGIEVRQTLKPAIHVEGDFHSVYNNLSFGNQVRDICLPVHGGWANEHAIVRNNVTGPDGIGVARRPNSDDAPGIADHNWEGDVRLQLRDVDNRDFRPRADSDLIKAGYNILGITRGYHIGPYGYGREDYWIPGFKTRKASKPIPADGAKNARADTDLVWLGGYKAMGHDVYFGTSKDAVTHANRQSEEYQGNQFNNIFDPGKLRLEKDTVYYWRIDSATDSGIVKGDVWSFSIPGQGE